MKSTLFLVVTVAALLLAGCQKGATVEGQAGKKLTLEKPAAVTIYRGGMAKTDIQIRRTDLGGEVTIHFDDLPQGVEVVDAESKIADGGERATYTLQAGEGAELVENHPAKVTATGEGGIAVTESIQITVKEKS